MKSNTEYTILAIDTSCDETSVSVVRDLTVLSNLLPSQMEYHREFGGVVPSLARIAHQERIDNVIKKAMSLAKVSFEDIDAIAVTYGPGLAIALEVGLNKAKELAEKYSKPLITVNHMEGHLLSSFAERNSFSPIKTSLKKDIVFPVLGFLISGGHTELVLVRDVGDYKIIGETLDDSCGEAYDKCGRMMGLGYPAGPVISKFTKEHRKNTGYKVIKGSQSAYIELINKNTKAEYKLPIPMAYSTDLNFSFSGLKTAFSQLINEKTSEKGLSKDVILDLSVAFEAAALEQLAIKLRKAISIYKPTELWLGGGVVASVQLRNIMRRECLRNNIKMRFPYSNRLTGDNAAMIGVVASMILRRHGLKNNPEEGIYFNKFQSIDREPNLTF